MIVGAEYPTDYEGLYADEIRYADDSVGKLLGALDTHPSGRPNVVLLPSDHGESRGPRWWSYIWAGTGKDFGPQDDEAPLPEGVPEYLSAKPGRTSFIDHIRPDDLKRLQVLGYR
ncbi:MAG: sulfatase-like hydrolase/transferase [Myxococcota bacterium]|nr:sulfatase-like hydrolase/transferase [Myxococcota bacterium]